MRKIICILCLALAFSCAWAEENAGSNSGYTVVRKGTGVIDEGLSGEDTEIMVCGLEDASGTLVIPYEYDYLSLQAEDTVVIAEKDGRYGLMDVHGAVLLPIEYDYISSFTLNRASVQKKDKQGKYIYGAIDERGNFILPMEYKDIAIHSDGTMIAGCAEKIGEFEMDTRYGYMNMDGEWIIDPQFVSAMPFEYGYAQVQINASVRDPFSDTGTALRYGLINIQGEFVLPAEYGYIGNVSEDKTVSAEKAGEEYLFRLTENGAEEVKTVASDLVLEYYMPFTGSKVAKLGEEPTLEERASAGHGHPRLDGATALFPVYSAIVEAVYPEKTRYAEEDKNPLITCTKTNRAYDRLIDGKADIIFCAGPSDAQIAAAKAAGVEFELTPFGREAFVFIVNKDNPLENITVEQIRKIYSGEITAWEDLGVENLGGIIPYQRPDNSGSQTALERLMGDIPIMNAPKERISDGMSDILETIEYRNLPNAIGYTFRFFCTEMIGSDVKLLSIDGKEPSLDNIRNESYPITSTLYMVTRKGEENPNVQALMDWVLSEQGQSLVEKAGYVGVN